MADADVDGSHIRTLLLTFFYRYFEELVRGGNIYIAQPPLYRLQKGKDIRYVYTDDEKERVMEEMKQAALDKAAKRLDAKGKAKGVTEEVAAGEAASLEAAGTDGEVNASGIAIQRYKGLGEMNPEQLWDTTMNPDTRLMLQVTIEDAEEADRLFDVLMGSEVEPRRRFIQAHAKNVKNLDV
jgi:DNA gyrase subunit B